MIRLYLIRHGATAGNLEKRYIGQTDEPLCEVGIAQIEALKQKAMHADYLFVSPMLRTRQTAERLFPNRKPVVVSDFSEIDFGLFEGKTAEELCGNIDYQIWLDSMCRAPIPEGERISDFKVRCCQAFCEKMRQIPDYTTVALVVHGGVIMSILEAFAVPKQDFYTYHVENGGCLCAWYQRNGTIQLESPSSV